MSNSQGLDSRTRPGGIGGARRSRSMMSATVSVTPGGPAHGIPLAAAGACLAYNIAAESQAAAQRRSTSRNAGRRRGRIRGDWTQGSGDFTGSSEFQERRILHEERTDRY